MSIVQPLGKISVKNVCGELKGDRKPKEGEGTKMLMRIIGNARGTKVVATAFGESIGFLGNFRATNIDDGQVFQSGTLFLPELATNLVAPMLAENQEVAFAFDIGAVYKASSATEYEYVVIPLIDQGGVDPLADLVSKLPALPAKLLAPAKVEEVADAKAEETKPESKGAKK